MKFNFCLLLGGPIQERIMVRIDGQGGEWLLSGLQLKLLRNFFLSHFALIGLHIYGLLI